MAITLFGQHGLTGVSTRAIAEAAGAQQSAIAHHFGTKESLYLACAEHIASTIGRRLASLPAVYPDAQSPDEAAAAIERTIDGLAVVMLTEDIAPLARFVVREQMQPTQAFDILWDGAIRQVAEPMIAWAGIVAGGRLPEAQLRLRCFTLLSQAFAFRFGRASLMRLTGWSEIGGDEVAIARAALTSNVRASLAALAKVSGQQLPSPTSKLNEARALHKD